MDLSEKLRAKDDQDRGLSKNDFTDPLLRIIKPNPHNVDRETDDGMWRGSRIEIPLKTSMNGYHFSVFPSVKTKNLFGVNPVGSQPILFRKTNGLIVRGKRHRGLFNPVVNGEIIGSNFRGYYGDSFRNIYPAFPDGVAGDCWMVDAGTGSVTANGLTFLSGDLLVKTASGYAIQKGPPITESAAGFQGSPYQEGDFWNVFATRVFAGIQLIANERIVFIGNRLMGGQYYAQFVASKPGEFFLMGECNASFPSAGTTARTGDMYNFTTSATTPLGGTGEAGDTLVYLNNWTVVKGEAVLISQGNPFFLRCENANEWSVRRQDKLGGSAANPDLNRLTVTAYGYQATILQSAVDNIVLWSDSMFGTNLIGQKILDLLQRNGIVNSFGGATSEQVLSCMRNAIRNGDPYAGWVNIIWHGQNNVSIDETQTKHSAYQMAALIGSNNKRFIFWSVLGARDNTWNNGRINCLQFEQAKTGANYIARIEQFYASSFAKQWWSPRVALLESAIGRTKPDLQFPGMTEEQVATTYGIVPFSYFFEYSTKPFNPANLNFVGYHAVAGLPTGGANNDYYIRNTVGVATEVIGNIIVKVAGTWVEYTHDRVHLTVEGSDIMAAKFANDMISIGL